MKPTADIVQQAARWSALLDADDVPQQQRMACEAWCAQNPMHRQALDRMRALGEAIDALGDSERRTLARIGVGKLRVRSRQRNTLLGIAALALAGWWASQGFTARQHWADHRTARGELRTLTLADASKLVIDTQSSASVSLTAGRRTVRLFSGRVFTTVSPDPHRPFVVETDDGTATALGTAFSVRRSDVDTEVAVSESRVLACARQRRECVELGPGERALIHAAGVTRLDSSAEPDIAWTTGWLEVDDRPLPEVLAELNRYSARPLQFDARGLAHLRITGSYPLNDPERAVAAITASLGLDPGQLR